MWWLPMKLIQCRFSTGQRDRCWSLPILIPFIYVQRKLKRYDDLHQEQIAQRLLDGLQRLFALRSCPH